MYNDWVSDFISKLLKANDGKEYINLRTEKLPFINRPLYKYCYVCENSGRNETTIDYNIDNFENDVLFFQNPIYFNDPFDCYLGFSQSQIVKDLFIGELKRKKQYTPEIRQVIDTLFKNDNENTDYGRLLNSSEFLDMVNTMIDIQSNEENIEATYIKNIFKAVFAKDTIIFEKLVNNTLTILDKQYIIDVMLSDTEFRNFIRQNLHNVDNADFILEAIQHDMKLKVETHSDVYSIVIQQIHLDCSSS